MDTNSAWMGGQLALAGIDSHFQTKGGGQPRAHGERPSPRPRAGRCGHPVRRARPHPGRHHPRRHRGGHGGSASSATSRWRTTFAPTSRPGGREMPLSNLRQADVPAGASRIPQMPGTAPGLVCPFGEKVIYAVPGVPYEMRIMLEGTIPPGSQAPRRGVLRHPKPHPSHLGHLRGAPRGALRADRLDVLEGTGRATIAFLASGEVEGLKVRVTAPRRKARRGGVAGPRRRGDAPAAHSR